MLRSVSSSLGSIGPAGPDDLDALERLETRSFDAAVVFSRSQLRNLLRNPAATVLVLRYGGEVAADAILLRRKCRGLSPARSRGGAVTARLYSLAVLPHHRGKKLGKALLAACLDLLRLEGVRAVTLEVHVENAPAVALYESFGFRKARRLTGYYGPGHDAWKMHLSFAGPERK